MPSTVVLLWSVLLTLPPAGQAPGYPFVETFAGDQVAQRWHPMTGKWTFGDGAALQADAAYDHGAGIAIKPTGAYWLSVRFKPESGFAGGGLYFGLPQVDRRNDLVKRRAGGGQQVHGSPKFSRAMRASRRHGRAP
jgi:hypothetical protein